MLDSTLRLIPDGRELLEALVEAFPSSQGWVLASGSVDDVELSLAGPDAEVRRTLRGRYTLIGLSGPLRGPYGATLSRWDGERCEITAGIVMRARSAGVQAVCVGLASAGLPGQVAVASAELPSQAAAAEVKEIAMPIIPPAAPAPGFAARAVRVAQALRAAEAEPDDLGEPEQGDHVQHFAFGLCEVLSATGDRLVIRDLSRAGRIREISTDMLVIHAPTDIEGKRVFRLTRRG